MDTADQVLKNASSLYDVLGVSATATDQDIDRAYRQRALALHPDRLGPDAANEETKRALQLVQDAHSALSDSSKRVTYDLARKLGNSKEGQEALASLHLSVATQILFSSTSEAFAPVKPMVRKCSCGKDLAKPDDLLCSSCSLFKPANRCKQMGCLNDVRKNAVEGGDKKPTAAAEGMCVKCAMRRKCTVWGCMRKAEAVDRDVCEVHQKEGKS